MKILIISRKAGELQSPVISVRIIEILEYLRGNGYLEYAIACETSTFAMKMIPWADYIIFNKHSSDKAYHLALVAKEKGLRIICDIDDLITAWPQSHKFLYEQKSTDFTRFIDIADVVTVENDRIFTEISKIHNRIVTIRNSIDIRKYQEPKFASTHSHSYCFSAYSTKFIQFERNFLATLCDFHSRYRHMHMSFYGDNLYHIMKLPFVQHIPMSSYRSYMDSIIKNDLMFAVTPLGGIEDIEDYNFNKCKSPIKYIMYGYAKIPGLYSNVPPYNLYISHNETGILFDNDGHSFLDAMVKIYSDRRLRRKISENAYEDVRNNFSTGDQAMIYLDRVLH